VVAGEEFTVGQRLHTVRLGQGKTACTAWLAIEVVRIVGLTTDDQYGTPCHARQHNRRDCDANMIHGVVVRTWNKRKFTPEGRTVFLTHASVGKPWQPFDDDRSLIDNRCIKEAKPQGDLGHPLQKTGRCAYMWCAP
jgi:hypothetical protein